MAACRLRGDLYAEALFDQRSLPSGRPASAVKRNMGRHDRRQAFGHLASVSPAILRHQIEEGLDGAHDG